MITLVVSLIFISNNLAASLGLPAIGDESTTLQEFREDELELQPRVNIYINKYILELVVPTHLYLINYDSRKRPFGRNY